MPWLGYGGLIGTAEAGVRNSLGLFQEKGALQVPRAGPSFLTMSNIPDRSLMTQAMSVFSCGREAPWGLCLGPLGP